MNYEVWKTERWETPVSDIRSVTMVSLIDNNEDLEVILEATRSENRPRWAFRFKNYPAYRNLMEGYRLKLWKYLDDTDQRCGHTFTVQNSPWLELLQQEESLLEVAYPRLQHFVITTEDDVVEVLSPEPAEVEFLGNTAENSPVPGKSDIFHYPEDGLTLREILDEGN